MKKLENEWSRLLKEGLSHPINVSEDIAHVLDPLIPIEFVETLVRPINFETEFLKERIPPLLEKFNSQSKGILIVGPEGCGKTTIAKIFAKSDLVVSENEKLFAYVDMNEWGALDSSSFRNNLLELERNSSNTLLNSRFVFIDHGLSVDTCGESVVALTDEVSTLREKIEIDTGIQTTGYPTFIGLISTSERLRFQRTENPLCNIFLNLFDPIPIQFSIWSNEGISNILTARCKLLQKYGQKYEISSEGIGYMASSSFGNPRTALEVLRTVLWRMAERNLKNVGIKQIKSWLAVEGYDKGKSLVEMWNQSLNEKRKEIFKQLIIASNHPEGEKEVTPSQIVSQSTLAKPGVRSTISYHLSSIENQTRGIIHRRKVGRETLLSLNPRWIPLVESLIDETQSSLNEGT